MTDMEQDDSSETSSFDEPKKNRFVKTRNFFSTINEKITPALPYLKNRYLRYSVSFVLLGLVVYLYILYEKYRDDETAPFLFFSISPDALVPMGLVFALLMVFYVSWDDAFFKKYRTPGLYMVVLTTVFYALIFSGLSEYLFKLEIARWLTRLTGTIVSSVLIVFGVNIRSVTWLTTSYMTRIDFGIIPSGEGIMGITARFFGLVEHMTKIDFITAPSGEAAILIDAACSGIHSLTIFTVIFLIMLFEARRRMFWGCERGVITIIKALKTYFASIPQAIQEEGKKVFIKDFSLRLTKVLWVFFRVGLITLIGILGTYIVNLIRIIIIITLFYFYGGSVGYPVHNYLGYAMLILWLPIFWLFILPIGERKELKKKRKLRRKEKRMSRKKKKLNQKSKIKTEEEEIIASSSKEIDESSLNS
ncbi:MAG: hypothetical protein KAU62_03070 [Candidatus Heimdallarchaeota archaeon]|nr:hypothetical protein [Candidatus Heimdallarchaeota archaeon]MCG3255044.1 hypothetical protein [Candidatus Heimdallarchaeota archaeon]MCK4610118.1 hypothetical protein [Candidatus Heimdallarchaeota archaeon]